MSHQLLAAGLLGFGLASALLKHIASMTTKTAILVVVPCIIGGAYLSTVVDSSVYGKEAAEYLLHPIQWFYLALILFIVVMKFRQRRA